MDTLKFDEGGDQKQGEPSELWKKMALMRKLQERFQALQDEEDDLADNQKTEELLSNTVTKSGRIISKPGKSKENAVPVAKATSRWKKIRRIVLSDKINRLRGERSANATPSHSPRLLPSDQLPDEAQEDREGGCEGGSSPKEDRSGENDEQRDGSRSQGRSQSNSQKNDDEESNSNYNKNPTDSLELEDINLDSFWDKNEIKSFEISDDVNDQIVRPEEKPLVFENFTSLVTPQALPVQRIPEEIVQEKKAAIEKMTIEKHRAALNSVKKMQVDIVYREDLARKRVKEMEKKARNNLLVEKAKVIKLTMEKDKEISHNFRKAREDLEAGIKRQEGAVKENFGSIMVHRDSLARKYQVYTQLFPQPIEFRIHMLRGVKNKLPKGAYTLMLTQYDSLGGHPISYTHLDACGIGSARPGITRIVKHPGRYFDRVMRFEDSVYALCPPGPHLRPSFVFVLELFHLASHKNPLDEIVAWTALPMSFENMTLVEGKMRLPMLRGEHSPHFQHFRTMEQTIANDLSHWLCNIYFEVRHLSLQELGATEAMLKSANYDLDYIGKSVVSGTDVNKVLLSYEEAYQDSIYATNHQLLSSHKSETLISTKENGLTPMLPVDKGIFRRKITHHHNCNTNNSTNSNTNNSVKDIEQGMMDAYDEEKKGNHHNESSSQHQNNNNQSSNSHLLNNDNGNSNKAGTLLEQFSRFISGKGNTILPQSNSNNNIAQQTSSFHGESRLSKIENFAEHRQEMIHKWKQNIRLKLSKLDHDDNDEELGEVELLERGYNLKDEEYLHPVQRGKLSGVEFSDDPVARVWGAAGLEGTVVRKWQSEGPRLDNDAISPVSPTSPKNLLKSPKTPVSLNMNYSTMTNIHEKTSVFFPDNNLANNNSVVINGVSVHRHADGSYERDVIGWEELRDGRELSEYTASIAYDPTRSKHLMPGAISRSKLRYMMLELFGDLFPMNYGTFDFYLSIFCYVFALWMRIYIHYLSQYLYILGVGTPVYDFHLDVLQMFFKYSSLSISDATEVAIVAIGMIGNIVLMLLFSLLGVLMYQVTDLMPDGFSKFFAAYGVVVVLDPYLVTLIDLIYHNYGCRTVSETCATAYTTSACDCFYGDFVKLYNRMLRNEGSGITGAFITFVLFTSCSVLSLFILYEYLVYVHRDGRILDLWRRITAPADEFFIPDDLEVSRDELQLVLSKCRRWVGPDGARRKIVQDEAIEKDPEHKNFLGKYTRYVILEMEKDGSSVIHRQFVMDHTGKIVEIFEDHKSKLQRQNVFAVFNKKSSIENNNSNIDDKPQLESTSFKKHVQSLMEDKDDIGKDMEDNEDEEDKEDGSTSSKKQSKPSVLLDSLVPGSRRNSHQSISSRRNSNSDNAPNSSFSSQQHEGKESMARASSETGSTAPSPQQQQPLLPTALNTNSSRTKSNPSSAPNSARRSLNNNSNSNNNSNCNQMSPRAMLTASALELEHLEDWQESEDAVSPLHPQRFPTSSQPQPLNNSTRSSGSSNNIALFDATTSANITPRNTNINFTD